MTKYTIGAIPDVELANLGRFVDRVQREVASTTQCAIDGNADRELTANAMVAALLIIAARVASTNSRHDGQVGLQRSFLLGAAEAFEIIAEERNTSVYKRLH